MADETLQSLKDRIARERQTVAGPPESAPSPPALPTTTGDRPDRKGRVLIAGHFPVELRRHLKRIAADEDKTLQQVMAEAFALYLAARKRKAGA